GDDGEAEPVFTGAGGFDGGVEGEQVGLVGDVVDQDEQGVDVGDPAGQGQRAFAGQGDVGFGLFEVVAGFGGLPGDFVDGVGDGRRGSGQFLGGGGGLGHRGALLGGGGCQLIRRRRQLRRSRIHLHTRSRDLSNELPAGVEHRV